MKIFHPVLKVLLLIGVTAFSGCGNYENRVPVSGTVTFEGKPLGTGFVSFVGSEGYAVASGEIRDGRYTLSTSASRPGIDAGEYAVRVESWEEEPGAVRDDGSFAPGRSAIPKRYQDVTKSGLSAKVTPSDRRFDFQLTREE